MYVHRIQCYQLNYKLHIPLYASLIYIFAIIDGIPLWNPLTYYFIHT